MFDNVGGKIKGIATTITGLGISVSVVLFLIFLARLTIESAVLGIAILIVGCLVSWLSSLALYGFGQLIENSDIIAGRISIDEINKKTADDKISNEKTASDNGNVDQITIPKRSQTFEELVDHARLPQENIIEAKRLKEMKDKGEISDKECRKKVRKLISDLAIDDIYIIMKRL